MAAALFNRHVDPSRGRAISAGTQPGDQVHPEVAAALLEVGIDVGNARPRKLTDELARQAQVLVTMGCGDECPYVPGARREDWPLQDPKGQPIEVVRAIRDEIQRRVADLISRERVGKQ
jgi:protein-tyrosine-phosphatase